MTVIRLLPFMFTVALVACSPGSGSDPASSAAAATPAAIPKPATTTARWQCGELRVTTRFDDEALQSMTLSHSGQELALKAVDADEGARFADAAGNEFWSRPGQVSLALADQPAIACSKSPGK